MRNYRKQILLGVLIILAFYIGFLLILDSQGQLSSTDGVLAQIRNFPLGLVIPLIGFQLLVILFRFVEWQYYLGVIDARHKISVFDSFVIFVATFTMVVSPGKAAEVVKSVLLKAKTGVPIARSAPIVIAERVVDGLAVIVIMFVVLLVAGDQLNLGSYGSIDYGLLSRTIIYSSTAIIATGLLVIQIKPLAYFFLHLVQYIPLMKRLHRPLIAFYESSREIFALRHVVPMTMVGVGVYLSSALGFLTVLYGLGLDVSWQLFLQALFIVGVASAVGALSFIPNGAGVTEISNQGMLLALVAPLNPVMTAAVAAAAALLQGFFHKWFRVLAGLLIGFLYRERLFSGDLAAALAEAEAERGRERSTQAAVAMEGRPTS